MNGRVAISTTLVLRPYLLIRAEFQGKKRPQRWSDVLLLIP